jgi:hypothetical protein
MNITFFMIFGIFIKLATFDFLINMIKVTSLA